MRIEKTKNAVKNISFGFLNKILTIVFPFIIKTIIIYKLGVDYLGLNSLFASILNILNFAEIGFGTAIIFTMYKAVADNNTEEICALLNLYKKIYRIIGLIIIAFGLITTPLLPYLIKGNYPADINLYVLYLIYLFNNVCGYFFFAYKSSLLSVHQRNDISSIIGGITNSLGYIIQIALLFAFSNYYIYIIITPIATVINNLLIGYVTKKKYPQYTPTGKVPPEKIKDITSKVFGLLCHKVGSVVQNSIDNLAISAFFGVTILGIYSNYLYILSAVQAFIVIINQSVIASVANNIYKEDMETNRKLFNRLNFASCLLIIFCFTCLLTLFQPFMVIWNRVDIPLNLSVIILISILFLVNNIQSTVFIFREAIGLWDKDKIRPLLITVVNLVGTIISAMLGSLEGIVFSTILAYIIVGFYMGARVLFKYYFKTGIKKYFLKLFVFLILAGIVSTTTYFVVSLIPAGGIAIFILKAVVCVLLTSALLILLTFKTNNFKFWIGWVLKKLRKNKNIEEN